jgi:hypothetical protein
MMDGVGVPWWDVGGFRLFLECRYSDFRAWMIWDGERQEGPLGRASVSLEDQ